MVVFTSLAVLSKQFIIGPALLWPKPILSQPRLELYLAVGLLGLPWLAVLYGAWGAFRRAAWPWRGWACAPFFSAHTYLPLEGR